MYYFTVALYSALAYQEPWSGQKCILMINQALQISGLEDHLLCPMQCHLNGMHTREVTTFLTERPNVATHSIHSLDPFDTAHPPIIPLRLSFDQFPK